MDTFTSKAMAFFLKVKKEKKQQVLSICAVAPRTGSVD